MSSFPIAGVLACLVLCTGQSAVSQSLPSVTGASVLTPAPVVALPRFPETQRTALATPAVRTLPYDLPEPSGFRDELEQQNNLSAFGIRCGASIALTRRPAAAVGVTINSPCRRAQEVLIRHAGMGFRKTLSGTGQLFLELPVLEKNAKIETVFENGDTRLGSILMPDLEDHVRLAVMWDDADLAELVPGNGSKATGALVTLGQAGAPKLQVYSHPYASNLGGSVARVHILNRITEEACTEARTGRVLRVEPEQAPIRYHLRLRAPGCEAEEPGLVLKNILADLTLTAK